MRIRSNQYQHRQMSPVPQNHTPRRHLSQSKSFKGLSMTISKQKQFKEQILATTQHKTIPSPLINYQSVRKHNSRLYETQNMPKKMLFRNQSFTSTITDIRNKSLPAFDFSKPLSFFSTLQKQSKYKNINGGNCERLLIHPTSPFSSNKRFNELPYQFSETKAPQNPLNKLKSPKVKKLQQRWNKNFNTSIQLSTSEYINQTNLSIELQTPKKQISNLKTLKNLRTNIISPQTISSKGVLQSQQSKNKDFSYCIDKYSGLNNITNSLQSEKKSLIFQPNLKQNKSLIFQSNQQKKESPIFQTNQQKKKLLIFQANQKQKKSHIFQSNQQQMKSLIPQAHKQQKASLIFQLNQQQTKSLIFQLNKEVSTESDKKRNEFFNFTPKQSQQYNGDIYELTQSGINQNTSSPFWANLDLLNQDISFTIPVKRKLSLEKFITQNQTLSQSTILSQLKSSLDQIKIQNKYLQTLLSLILIRKCSPNICLTRIKQNNSIMSLVRLQRNQIYSSLQQDQVVKNQLITYYSNFKQYILTQPFQYTLQQIYQMKLIHSNKLPCIVKKFFPVLKHLKQKYVGYQIQLKKLKQRIVYIHGQFKLLPIMLKIIK